MRARSAQVLSSSAAAGSRPQRPSACLSSHMRRRRYGVTQVTGDRSSIVDIKRMHYVPPTLSPSAIIPVGPLLLAASSVVPRSETGEFQQPAVIVARRRRWRPGGAAGSSGSSHGCPSAAASLNFWPLLFFSTYSSCRFTADSLAWVRMMAPYLCVCSLLPLMPQYRTLSVVRSAV